MRIYLSMWLYPHRHMIKQISLKLIFLTQFSFAVNEEYYVLFRGVHFSTEKPIPAVPIAPQIVYSPYSAKPQNRLQDTEKKRAFETLKYIVSSGAPDDRLPNGMSAYDWIQQHYVNNYKQFKLDCANPHSNLRHLLTIQPALRDINEPFLVSTTFSAHKALQYAAGMCGPKNRRRLPIENVNGVLQLTNPIIGYVDVFVIPANQITGGIPYFVLEEFTKHNITIPHQKWPQENYTHQEEVNFPFFIPAQFHRARIMVDVRLFGLPPRNPARWGNDAWLREQFEKMGAQLELNMSTQLQQMHAQRAFLGPLAYQLNARTYRLTPTDAIANRNEIAKEIPVLMNKAEERQGMRNEFLYAEPFLYLVIINFPFNFASVYALQNIAKTRRLDLSSLSYSFSAPNAALLAPLLESSNVIRIALARAPAKTISVQEEMYHRHVCSTQIAFFQKIKNYLQDVWIDTNPAILETILHAIRKRRDQLSIIMPNEILAPHIQNKLLDAFAMVSADIQRVYYSYGTFFSLHGFLTHYIEQLCQDLDCTPAEIDLNSVPELSDAFMVNEAIYYLQPRF